MGNSLGGEEVKDNSVFSTLEFPVVDLPLDSEGYVKSFSISEATEFKQFYEDFGFVIINNVVTSQEVEDTVDEIWTFLEAKEWTTTGCKVDRNDSSTWSKDYFPANAVGILGSGPAFGPCTWRNRQNPNIYKIFSTIYGTPKLWVSLDRWGLMRPTKNVPIGKLDEVRARTTVEGLEIKGRGLGTKPGEEPQIVEDHRAWRTRPLWIHWDLNPWIWCLTKEGEEYHFQEFIQENNGSPNDGLGKAQGILNLVDSKEGDGGFCCVPGFHKHLKEYATLTANTQYARQSLVSRSFVNVPQDDPLNKQVKKISLRAGSMVVWNSELPHCNYPNERFVIPFIEVWLLA
eukprot:TRINITY_DN150_c1_g1_i3.p1 TRINITY_DN150_c1_g1~~TRINITY_DN150_c1_g1_i3.p1  ORF type:complete len:344 (-),score=46.68 TRINITY_DN150_c1_g1_i3:72-1103(-)